MHALWPQGSLVCDVLCDVLSFGSVSCTTMLQVAAQSELYYYLILSVSCTTVLQVAAQGELYYYLILSVKRKPSQPVQQSHMCPLAFPASPPPPYSLLGSSFSLLSRPPVPLRAPPPSFRRVTTWT